MSRAKFVELCPHATIERQRDGGGFVYYLVRRRRGDFMYIGSGDTKARAWADAWEKLVARLKPIIDQWTIT